MASNKSLRTLVTVFMDIVIVVAVIELLRVVIAFFGALSSASWGEVALRLTTPLVIPFGIEDITTPYGGVFEVDAVVTIIALLALEWVLSIVRKQV